MKINIKNLGIIQNAEIDLSKDLIVFTGYNNTGKTYLNYLLYGLYKIPFGRIQKQFYPLVEIEDLSDNYVCLQTNISKLFNQKFKEIEQIYENLLIEFCVTIFDSSKIKPEIKLSFDENKINFWLASFEKNYKTETNFFTGFNKVSLNDDKGKVEFSNGSLKFSFERISKTNEFYKQFKENLSEIVKLNAYMDFERIMNKIANFNHIFQRDYNPKTYFFVAERATLNQYSNDLVFSKAEKYEQNSNPYPSETDKNEKKVEADYPLAVNEYIKLVYAGNLKRTIKKDSAFATYATELEQTILDKGRVIIDDNGLIKFQLQNKSLLELHETSSTVKSLVGFIIYLRHLCEIGDIIFIDEPELNLHPKNQIVFARILAKLINKGIKIILSTHSDFFTKELSSLVLLYKDRNEADKYWEMYGINEEYFINPEKVGLYSFNDLGEIQPDELNKYGIEISSFNEIIDQQSQMYNHFYYMVSNE